MNVSESTHPSNDEPPEMATSGDRLRKLYYDRMTRVKVWGPVMWIFGLILPAFVVLLWHMTVDLPGSDPFFDAFDAKGFLAILVILNSACWSFVCIRTGLVYADHAESTWEKDYRHKSRCWYAFGLFFITWGTLYFVLWCLR